MHASEIESINFLMEAIKCKVASGTDLQPLNLTKNVIR